MTENNSRKTPRETILSARNHLRNLPAHVRARDTTRHLEAVLNLSETVPDLIDALQDIVKLCEDGHDPHEEPHMLLPARAAIAKATGKYVSSAIAMTLPNHRNGA